MIGLKRCVISRSARGVVAELGVIRENSGGKTPAINRSKVAEFSKEDEASSSAASEATEQVGDASASGGVKVLEETANTSKSDKTILTTSSDCPEPRAGSRFVDFASMDGVSFKIPTR